MTILTFTFPLTACYVGIPVTDIGVQRQDTDSSPISSITCFDKCSTFNKFMCFMYIFEDQDEEEFAIVTFVLT